MMIKDYSKYVEKMSDVELYRIVEEIGKTSYIGATDEYCLFSAASYEKKKRDDTEKEFLGREEIPRFDLMEF